MNISQNTERAGRVAGPPRAPCRYDSLQPSSVPVRFIPSQRTGTTREPPKRFRTGFQLVRSFSATGSSGPVRFTPAHHTGTIRESRKKEKTFPHLFPHVTFTLHFVPAPISTCYKKRNTGNDMLHFLLEPISTCYISGHKFLKRVIFIIF